MPLCDATTSDPKGLRAGSLSHALWLSFLSPLGCQRMTSVLRGLNSDKGSSSNPG